MRQGLKVTGQLVDLDLLWFEEPTTSDDDLGYACIAEATGMPIAIGENLHTIHEIEDDVARTRHRAARFETIPVDHHCLWRGGLGGRTFHHPGEAAHVARAVQRL